MNTLIIGENKIIKKRHWITWATATINILTLEGTKMIKNNYR